MAQFPSLESQDLSANILHPRRDRKEGLEIHGNLGRLNCVREIQIKSNNTLLLLLRSVTIHSLNSVKTIFSIIKSLAKIWDVIQTVM